MTDYNWITDNVALGSAPTSSWIPRMLEDGITDVLDLRSEADSSSLYAGTGITYHRVPMIDDGRTQPVSAYQQAVGIIEQALADPTHKILVHCAAGQYRSPSVVYAYLRALGYPSDLAWNTIVSARSVARQQYVPGAEAAVPYLPAPGSIAPASSTDTSSVAIALIVAAAAGAAVYWYNKSNIGTRSSRRRLRYSTTA